MKTKKIISALLIFAFVFTLMPSVSAAKSTEDIVVKVLVEPSVIHRRVENFSEGLAAFQGFGGNWGYMDKTGKTVIPLDYWSADPFSEGLAVVSIIDGDGKCGVIDKTGKTVIEFGKYEYIGSFREGLAVVRKGDEYGYIDKTGKLVISYQFYSAESFSEGLALVSKNDDKKTWGRMLSFIDKTGKTVIKLDEYAWGQSFSEGLALVQKGMAMYNNVKLSYIDKTGKVVVPIEEYPHAESYSEGFAAVYSSIFTGATYGGYIDKAGELVIPSRYSIAGPFIDGVAVVATGQGDYLYGVIDKAGNEILPLEYDYISQYNNGAAVVCKDGKYSVINIKGKTIFTCDYAIYSYFHDGVAVTLSGGFDGEDGFKWGIIEAIKVGYPIGDVLYSDITAYINGYAIPTSVINGKTLVVAEDLAKYGFDVKWDGAERTLKVEQNKNKKFAPIPTEKDTTHKPGTFKQHYLYTDIKTYLSGEEVESYAIDGRTLINFELLKKYGKITWDSKARELRLVIGGDIKNEAYDLYQRMNRAMSDVKSIDMDLSLEINSEQQMAEPPLDFSGRISGIHKINGNIKRVEKNTDDWGMEIKSERFSRSEFHGAMPQSISVGYDAYYTGGVYYEAFYFDSFLYPEKSKMTMTADEVIKKTEIDGFEILDFPVSAITNCTITDLIDGRIKIKFILDGKHIPKYNDWFSPSLDNSTLTINEFICEAVIDKNNMMESYKMRYDILFVNSERDGRITADMSMTVNSYNGVKIDFPSDLDKYNEIA